jgi:hypothetical protein
VEAFAGPVEQDFPGCGAGGKQHRVGYGACAEPALPVDVLGQDRAVDGERPGVPAGGPSASFAASEGARRMTPCMSTSRSREVQSGRS